MMFKNICIQRCFSYIQCTIFLNVNWFAYCGNLYTLYGMGHLWLTQTETDHKRSLYHILFTTKMTTRCAVADLHMRSWVCWRRRRPWPRVGTSPGDRCTPTRSGLAAPRSPSDSTAPARTSPWTWNSGYIREEWTCPRWFRLKPWLKPRKSVGRVVCSRSCHLVVASRWYIP